ncbi:PAS domain-containing protein [Kitasatospora sp. NPDC094015]|uniref:PAS domain-containing protein n=1 Tax=Kitasatospora sp. NPDC094015 TaxID=3155205 RepID=UPI00331A3B09
MDSGWRRAGEAASERPGLRDALTAAQPWPDGDPLAQRWFATLAAYAPAPAFVRDREGRYLWVNAAYAHLYQLDPQAVAGRRVEEIDRPADAAQFLALDQDVLASRRPVRHTLEFRHPDGTPGQVVGHRFVLDSSGGPCVGGIYSDVTSHTRALEEKAAADEEMHALRERTGLAVVTLTPDGRVERASGGAVQLLGAARSELEGSAALDHLDPATDPGPTARHWQDLLAGRTSRASTVVRLRVADGGRLLRADLAAVRAHGVTDRVVAVLTPLGAPSPRAVRVSPLQLRVLTLMAGGEPNSGMAALLGLSRQALDYHLRRLRELLRAASRPEMVARAYALGILDATAWPPRATAGVLHC